MASQYLINTANRASTTPLPPEAIPGANPLVPVTPTAAPATALTCLKRSLELDKLMYGATRNKGKVDENSQIGWANGGIVVAALGTIVAGTTASMCIFGATAGAFWAGLIGSLVVAVPGGITASVRLDNAHTTAVIPKKLASPFVDPYVDGDALSQRMLSLAAARWHGRIVYREVAGVFVRQQLKALSDVPAPKDAKVCKTAAALDAIATCLRGGSGGPLQSLGKDALAKIDAAVQELEGEDRRQVCMFLMELLYKDERPRFTVDQGASQRLLETLASLQPFQGLSSARLAELSHQGE